MKCLIVLFIYSCLQHINTRNNKTFSSIQNAIDDVDTNDGDTLKIRSGIYVENIYILKRVSLTSFGDGEVIIIPFNESLSTVTILVDGSALNNLSVYGTSFNTAVFSVANNETKKQFPINI